MHQPVRVNDRQPAFLKGMQLLTSRSGRQQRRRRRHGCWLSDATKVQFIGILLVGKAYSAQLGLQPSRSVRDQGVSHADQAHPLGASREE